MAQRQVRLTRARVLEEAVALADEGGVAALTIRALAERLGVKPMSLYHHVPHKEAILDGIVDAVFAEMELPPEDLDWRSALHRRAHSARAVLARHPWAAAVLESRAHPGPATLRHHDAVLGVLRRGGFPYALAGHAYSLLDSYVYGFALTEAALPFAPQDVEEAVGELLEGFPAEDYPNLVDFARHHVMRPGYAYGAEFDYGLDLLLDGLESRLAQVRP
ncbi:TetR/AcrR family transcriptional regulator [Streptomyces sp. WAC06614]|uniref:TetR/AcrR family transcriptional regulator n=1 Tax=Streptomyces sp. WAC06614 TaxID=2487416 RepID=UPI000F78F2AA|nr:TetR/AcrR family transcriptional regulator C-terminal domain-containing protein [Streptomyces sp. WAC06614]RSS80280.1 TetR family transcriptional regulator [Streptomyces sp. WAC06614]